MIPGEGDGGKLGPQKVQAKGYKGLIHYHVLQVEAALPVNKASLCSIGYIPNKQ